MKMKCRGPVKKAGSRAGCGHDLSDLIARVPADGNEHTIKCSRCGNKAGVKKTPPEA